MTGSLRVRLVAAQMGLLVLLLAVIQWRFHVLVEQAQLDDTVHHLQVQALVAAGALEELGGEAGEHGRSSALSLQRWAEQFASGDRIGVEVFDALGRVTASAGTVSGMTGSELDAALQGREGSRVDGARIYVAAPVTHEGRLFAVVRLTGDTSEASARTHAVTLNMLITSLLVLVAAAAIVLWTSQRLLQPLRDLRAGAEAVAAGDLEASVREDGDSEIASVSRAFNVMVSALKKSDERQRSFVANASHELRTPLTNIKLRAEALLADVSSAGDRSARYLADIDSETDRLARLAASLLDLSRVDAVAPVVGSADPLQVAAATVARMTAAAGARGQTIEVGGSAGCQVAMHPDDLEDVLVNLLDNAVKYGPEGGRIEVVVSGPVDGRVRVSVSDNGAGIPADDLPHVFERFYRVDKSRARGGAGLGLSLVKARVERVGGTVAVRSDGGGTVFVVEVPVT